MHSYLRAIGFSESHLTEYDLGLLLDDVYRYYDHMESVLLDGTGRAFLELGRSYGTGIGLKVCGELDGRGFHRQYYYPYVSAFEPTSDGHVTVERRVNGESYAGVVDDGRVGMSLIFHVQNPGDYMREEHLGRLGVFGIKASLVGLSTGGAVLLPVCAPKDEDEIRERASFFEERTNVMAQAKSGEAEAIQNLTLQDMSLYSMLNRRIETEDVFSIVETTFMPHGLESDVYKIIGIIRRADKVRNTYTGEELWRLAIESNGIPLDISINETDLLGEPETGRRFEGTIWLQGRLNFGNAVEVVPDLPSGA